MTLLRRTLKRLQNPLLVLCCNSGRVILTLRAKRRRAKRRLIPPGYKVITFLEVSHHSTSKFNKHGSIQEDAFYAEWALRYFLSEKTEINSMGSSTISFIEKDEPMYMDGKNIARMIWEIGE